GYVRVRVDGKIIDLGDEIDLDKQKKHTIEVVVDRLVIRKGQKPSRVSPGETATHREEEHGDRKGVMNYGPYERAALKKVADRPALYDVNAEQDRPQAVEDGVSANTAVEPAQPQEEDVDPAFRQRLSDSLETTLKLGGGVVLVSIIDGEEILLSEKAACVYCGISLPEIAPRTFSFNSPHGACPTCTGLGTQQE